MTRASSGRTPVTISDARPAGAPDPANHLRDANASQVELRIYATGADVTLGAVAGGARTTYWCYDEPSETWGPFAPYAHEYGWTIVDGDHLPDIVRLPRGALALHIEVVNGINVVGNATADAQTVRGGA